MTEQEIKKLVTDFPSFVDYIWSNINLPPATPVQRDIAKTLQQGHKRLLIEAFRGIGKTYTTGAYACWRLLRNPNEKILIVSASGTHAKAISTFIHKLLNTVPLLEHLKPGPDCRNSVEAFDVSGCKTTVQPSVKCLGITSQLQGNRASILISDDVETSINSATETMRTKIIEQVNEFDSILQTNDDACIIGLGTPQTGDSIYNRFKEKGFTVKVWTARIPENPEVYEGTLSDYVWNMIAEGGKPGDVTDTRFTHDDLLQREVSVGKSYFRLQYQLDTSLSDADKYPLKQNDMIVFDVDRDKAPISIAYSSDRSNAINDIPNIGFTGDCFFKPGYVDAERANYDFSIMSIDPSGRGSDEMGYSVIKYLNGKIYVVDVGGLNGGYKEDNLFKLASIAKQNKVEKIWIESNFGDGMFDQLLKPVLGKVYPCTIEEVRSSKQKELRLIDTIEPLLNQHRLVFSKQLLLKDVKEALADPTKMQYSLVYQLTHLTKDRGCLRHDDRLDALAIALAAIVETVGVDEDEAKDSYLSEMKNEMLENWIDSNSDSRWFSANR
jgi:hypothetical protein